jgi:hypothetical protein
MKEIRHIPLLIVLVAVSGITSPIYADTTIHVPPANTFIIADTPTADEGSPAVAFDPGRQQYLVAYASYIVNTSLVYATCINLHGEVIVDYALGSGINPDIVYDPSHDDYIVVWEYATSSSVSHIMGIRIAGACCMGPECTGTPFNISDDRPGFEAWPAIAYNAHEAHQDFLVVWHDNENYYDHYGVWGRRMSGTTLMGSSFPINSPETSYNYAVDVAYNLNMNEFMVVWVRDPSRGTDFSLCDIWSVRLWNGEGSSGGIIGGSEKAIYSSTGEQFYPRIATYRLNHDTPYFVIFRDEWNDEDGDIRGYLVNKQGDPVQLVNISTQEGVIESYARLHSSEERGGYAVVWQEQQSGEHFNVKWRSITHDGNMGSIGVVTANQYDEGFPDVVNLLPFPFAVWERHGDSYGIFGRYLYTQTFLPAVLRNP